MIEFETAGESGYFDLARCVTSGQVFRWEKIDGDRWIGIDGAYWYVVCLSGNGYSVRTNGTERDFADLFRLDWQASEVERTIVEAGPELAPYTESLRGLRLMRPSSPVETLFSFLCSANNHFARIGAMVRTLAAFGDPIEEVEGRIVTRFPTIEELSRIKEEELRAKGFGYRGRTMPLVAEELLRRGGEPYLETLKEDYDIAFDALVELPGVGPKLADCIALFALHHDSVVPLDTHMWQAVTREYFPNWRGTALTKVKYREASNFLRNRFGRYAGWAHQYLFLDNHDTWRTRNRLNKVASPPGAV